MNTPSNKRHSSCSEYGTPDVDDDSENSLYFSFTVDDNTPNKENTINGAQWTITDSTSQPSASSLVLKAKTPLLRKVLQSNFTPRNKNNKRVSFNHLPKQNSMVETTTEITKTNEQQMELNSNTVFDFNPIKESLPRTTMAHAQTIFADNYTEHDTASDAANVTDDLDDEMQNNTIIENPISVNTNDSEGVKELIKMNNSSEKDSTNDCEQATDAIISKMVKQVFYEAATKPQQTRNVTKLDRRRLVKENRKSILNTRATTYKRRSSTYEPRKVDPRKSLRVLKQVASKLSKTVPGNQTILLMQ